LEQAFSVRRDPAFREDFESGSRKIAIVGAVTRQLLMKMCRLEGDLACALIICKVRKLAMVL
jgi:hypothetical protein